LIGPQTRLDGQPVAQSTLGTRHARSVRTAAGSVEQLTHLLDGEGPAVPPPIRIDLQAIQMGQRMVERAAILDRPAAELLAGLKVEVERLCRNAALVFRVRAQDGEVISHLAGLDVAKILEAAAVEHAPRTPSDNLDVERRVSLGRQRCGE